MLAVFSILYSIWRESEDLALMWSLVGLIASDGSGGETSHADPAIGKVKPEEALRVAKSLRSRDRVTQILDDVQDLSLLGSLSGLHLSLPLLLAFLGTISLLLVCFVDKKLALLL